MSKTSMSRLRKRLGAEVKVLRLAKGWTQVTAAKKIAMPQATLCVIEQGKQAPGMDTITRIARAYGVVAVFGDGGPVFRSWSE